ncbi:class I tRNA ligase family protein, partial [Candidatus Bathyarchaeota archaeon]|nr:class I tRNA ligase family protein [Candidatus Bathyarchaeota archaeon]
MNFDAEELKGRPYQVLSTLYHLHRFFMQNAEYDRFNPRKHTLQRAEQNKALKTPDRWLLSKLQGMVKEFTEKAEASEFNFALSELEEFVVNVLSRQYVPMIRRDLWSDDPETLNRRLAVYATLWHVLKTLVLLFNPVTSFLSEAMHQRVYRELDNTLPETVNLESWPKPDAALEDATLEEEFEVLLRCLPLVYSARQSARLKRRWPLNKAVVVAPKNVQKALKNLEELFLELANVKKVEYGEKLPEVDLKRWALASDVELHVLLDTHRDEALEGEGLMRDLARRVQALRKELGFMPTDILNAVHVAELDSKSVKLLEPYLTEMAELVRAKKVYVQEKR